MRKYFINNSHAFHATLTQLTETCSKLATKTLEKFLT